MMDRLLPYALLTAALISALAAVAIVSGSGTDKILLNFVDAPRWLDAAEAFAWTGISGAWGLSLLGWRVRIWRKKAQ